MNGAADRRLPGSRCRHAPRRGERDEDDERADPVANDAPADERARDRAPGDATDDDQRDGSRQRQQAESVAPLGSSRWAGNADREHDADRDAPPSAARRRPGPRATPSVDADPSPGRPGWTDVAPRLVQACRVPGRAGRTRTCGEGRVLRSDALTRRDYRSPPFGMARTPPTLGYTRAGISTLHTRYASGTHEVTLGHRPRRASPAIDPFPHIVTELPGPKARAHVAFDETWTSPSLPRAYPIVPVRGEGLTVEDIDGNLFLDFAAGIAVTSTGHSHPQVVAAIKEQAAELIHFSASRLLPADLPRGLPPARRARADVGPRQGVPRQLRHGGRGGLDQARAVRDQAAVRRGVPWRLPRADLRIGEPDRLQGEVPRRLRAAAARHLPRAVRAGRGPALVRRGALPQAGPGQRGGGDHRRADPGRGRLHRPRGRLPPGSPPDLRRARDPAHRRRDPVRRRTDRRDVGGRALGRRAGHPPDRQGHRVGHAAGRIDRPGRAARDMGPRRPRFDLRRQPGRLCRGARDDRAARERPDRKRDEPGRPGPGRAPVTGRPVPGARHATCAARA